MSTLADLKSQKAQAACFYCLPVNTSQAIKTYLLARLAGVTADPKTILALARAWDAIPSGMLPAVQAALSASMAGIVGDPFSKANLDACSAECLTPQDSQGIAILALGNKSKVSTDPKTLAKLAACFTCIPPGRVASAQAYLMAVIAGLVPAPPTTPGPPTGPPPTVPPAILKTAIKGFALPPTLVQIVVDRGIYIYGTSGGGGPNPPPPPTTDPLVTDWKTRAIANGGTPTNNTLTCLNTFCTAIRAQSYFTKLKSINFIAPDDFRCAMTPLIVHPQDSGLWQALSAGTSLGATTFVAGPNATLDATGIRCDLPWTANPGTNNFNPTAIWSSVNNAGFTVYQSAWDGAHGPFGECLGAEDAGDNNAVFGAVLYFGNTYMEWLNNATQIAQPHNGKFGYYSWNTTAANARNIYFANSTNAHASIASSGVAFTGGFNALAMVMNGSNQNGNTPVSSSAHYSFFAFHDGLTSSESSDFFNRIQTLRVCLGTGFV